MLRVVVVWKKKGFSNGLLSMILSNNDCLYRVIGDPTSFTTVSLVVYDEGIPG